MALLQTSWHYRNLEATANSDQQPQQTYKYKDSEHNDKPHSKHPHRDRNALRKGDFV